MNYTIDVPSFEEPPRSLGAALFSVMKFSRMDGSNLGAASAVLFIHHVGTT